MAGPPEDGPTTPGPHPLMPKKTKHPRLRSHAWRTSGGEVRCAYYYDMRGTGKPDIPLGTDYAAAILRWDELHYRRPRIIGTVQEAIERWRDECLPGYASATTRRNYAQNLRRIEPVFGPAAWDSITVATISEYLSRRTAKTQANREKACLSVIWGKAREWGMTTLPFPAYKMRLRNREFASHVEVTDEAFAAIYTHADQVLRDAMDIASATGLRVRDVLGLRLTDVRGDKMVVTAKKTGKAATFDLTASAILPAIIERRRAAKAPHVFLLVCGSKVVTERMLTDRFKAARAKAAAECPDCAGLLLRHMRKRAAQLAGSLQEAQSLLQHGSAATTQRHSKSAAARRASSSLAAGTSELPDETR
jgi:integrase